MIAFLLGVIFGGCAAGWFFALAARRPRLFDGCADISRAVRRPEVRESIARALKGGRT